MEIVDLVQETLERDGTFSMLRAQLRASVQKVIEGKSHKKNNDSLIRLVDSDSGRISLLLVQELLESTGLEQTLAAMRAECGAQVSTAVREAPLLCHI